MLATHCTVLPPYTHTSESVVDFFAVLQELSCKERGYFFFFITGSHAMSRYDLRNLQPPLTVVRVPGFHDSIPILPSVSTCTHMLRLPDYRDCNILRDRLLFVIRQARSGFQLS
uniref:E3 ubiquitin-protein ligase n=1 Tax=Lygus hesperus TaxID=30085 RepID=A0A0A9YHM1_LYGHE